MRMLQRSSACELYLLIIDALGTVSPERLT
jgi:hypothetical protein